uniref:Uncharacterized protein n=1 Tax=Oryza rufipogon TaxID=4529 RepID=A0A0E0NR66_ORYRU
MAVGGRRGSGARRRRRRERREQHKLSAATRLHHRRRVRSWRRTARAVAVALTAEAGKDVEAGALVRDGGGEVGPLLEGDTTKTTGSTAGACSSSPWLLYGGCLLTVMLVGPGSGRVLCTILHMIASIWTNRRNQNA